MESQILLAQPLSSWAGIHHVSKDKIKSNKCMNGYQMEKQTQSITFQGVIFIFKLCIAMVGKQGCQMKISAALPQTLSTLIITLSYQIIYLSIKDASLVHS